ncbi:MAG: DNA/RNA nuclease SfsA [Anaerolineae bacterium]|nr:DNA/RNA nuclease SfsA [Anaerolineae bacterium]
MRLTEDLVEGVFVRRLNRFVAEVEVAGGPALAHVPNSGRLRELLFAGARVLLAPRAGVRRTRFDVALAWSGAHLVSVDARLPGRLLSEALGAGAFPDLGPVQAVRCEVRLGASRLDLLVESPGGPWYVETKSVTLVRDGVALFPDAPTARGARHVEELRRLAAAGGRAAIAFVIQREDAEALRPHEEADPAFAAALRRAAPSVRVLAYVCRVSREEVTIDRQVPVFL